MKRIGAIVLAAGEARRMGSPKQLLRLGGRTLVETTLRHVAASTIQEIVLVLGARAESVRQSLPAVSGLKIVVNDGYAQGMSTSLQAGAGALSDSVDAVFIVLADQPAVQAGTFDALAADSAAHPAQILIPLYRGFRGNPVLLDRSMLPEVATLRGDMGCRALFGRHLDSIRKLPVDDSGVLLDVDQLSDLAILAEYSKWPLIETTAAAPFSPHAPEVIVVGRDEIAKRVTRLAAADGCRVSVYDPTVRFSEIPGAGRIVRSLDFSLTPGATRCIAASTGRFDEEAVQQALQADIAVTLVANERKAQELNKSLLLQGVDAGLLKKVRVLADQVDDEIMRSTWI